MAALFGGEVNAWLVAALLVLTLGLTGALLAATRETLAATRETFPGVRRTR
jgi:hypothetical protein